MSRAFPAGGYAPPIQFRRYSPGSITGSTDLPGRAGTKLRRQSPTVESGLAELGAEPAVPRGVGPQRPEEVHPPEGRPVGIAEVELRVDALPQQEAAQPLLPRGADHQVRVGLAGRVQVVGDVLHVQDLGQFLDAGSLGRVVVQQRPHRVGDLPPPAVAEATLTSSPGLCAVASAASLSACAVSTGSRSSAPTGLTCQPWATSCRTVPSMIRSRASTSDPDRDRLSVDSSHRVTTSTPAWRHQPSNSKMLSAPF